MITGTPPRRQAERDQRVAIHLANVRSHDRALRGDAAGRLRLYRPQQTGDMLRTPWPYAVLLLGLALPGWLFYRTRQYKPEAVNPALNAEPLPVSLKIAGGVLIAFGAWAVIEMVWSAAVGHVSLNFSALLLVASWGMLRRRSNGWRGLALLGIGLPLIAVAGMIGFAWTGPPLTYTWGQQSGPLPAHLAVLILFGLLVPLLWLHWALSNARVRTIFTAALYDTSEMDRLRRCVRCGYDVRATVAHARPACPECGEPLRCTDAQRRQIAEAFAREEASP